MSTAQADIIEQSSPATSPTDPVGIGQHILAQIDVPEESLEALGVWIEEELAKASTAREGLIAEIAEWERLYEARPKVKTKSEPWEGASNLVVPVIATAVDAVLSRMLTNVFGGKDLWVGVAKAADWTDLVTPVEKWLSWVGDNVIKMYSVCQRWFLHMIKTGTGILKLPWEQKIRNVRYKDAQGGLIEEKIILHDGPIAEPIALDDFYASADAYSTGDVQYCEWVAHRTKLTWKMLREREVSGMYYEVERVKAFKRTQSTDTEEEREKNQGIEPTEYNDYEIFEVWASYDVDEDGFQEELVVTYHRESKTILRAVYNFYRHQERPFHIIRLMPRDMSLLGIGICQMLYDIQVEITTIHNQRLDNATLANTKAFLRIKSSTITNEDIYPGAFIDVDSLDDVKPLDLGTEHSTLLQEELHTGTIGEKRSGVNDYTVGRESSAIGSRATATSTLALLREGNKRFAMTLQDIREAIKAVGHQIISLYQQFSPEGKVEFEMFSDEERRIVTQFLSLPPELSKSSIYLDVPALSEVENKEIMQQTMLTLMGVVSQFYKSMFEAFSVALNEQAPEPIKQLAAQGAVAGAKIWKRILEAFDFRDAESFVPDVEAMLGIGAAQESLEQTMGGGNGQALAGGPGGQPPGVAEPAGQQAMGPGMPGAGAEALGPELAGRLRGFEQNLPDTGA